MLGVDQFHNNVHSEESVQDANESIPAQIVMCTSVRQLRAVAKTERRSCTSG